MVPKVRLTHFQRLTLLAAPVSFGSLADSSPVNSTDRYRQSWAVPNLHGDIACRRNLDPDPRAVSSTGCL
jgi:hypothetical protein